MSLTALHPTPRPTMPSGMAMVPACGQAVSRLVRGQEIRRFESDHADQRSTMLDGIPTGGKVKATGKVEGRPVGNDRRAINATIKAEGPN